MLKFAMLSTSVTNIIPVIGTRESGSSAIIVVVYERATFEVALCDQSA